MKYDCAACRRFLDFSDPVFAEPMPSSTPDAMSSSERRAGAGLVSVFAVRMLGLFLILPVFSIHAKALPSGHDLALVGLALGAYGLTQTFLQIA